MQNRDEIFAQVAKDISVASKDRSTKVGAIIIGPDDELRSAGYNGFARGVNDDVEERHQRPEKYLWTIHAERNAIDNAARAGIATKGCSIYVPALFPCCQCAGSIINAGIVEVVTVEPDLELPKWGEEFKRSIQMFEEAGVKVRFL
jgi:dCMP deaminase